MTTPLETTAEPLSRPAFQRGRWLPDFAQLAFGGDYNPEQWPRETWDEDVRLMREAGVNLVSIGIFSWALLEPREGEFDFGWLDELIALLWSNGIRVSLGTPTASPPAWFWKKYPEARPVTRDGVALGFGSRGMASPSSPEYAAACTRIVTALAERYGTHPALAIWHVHNEYGAPVAECYSDYSARAFRRWLEARYGDLEALNDVWGTTFWGQRYGEWDEIDVPRRAASVSNPAQRLDFSRFSSDALLRCFIRERDILHRLSPSIPVTTNFMASSCPAVDLWKWADEVDIVANDHYLTAERTDNHVMLAMDADLTRSIARGRPWLLMEHSTSAVNWQERNLAKRQGELARNSLSHLGRGADGILFFQWRAGRFGAEKFHSAMLPHAGTDSRVWREVLELGSQLAGSAELRGTTLTARTAILWDWESFWAQDLEWRPSVDLGHRKQIETFYTALWSRGVAVDFVHPEDELGGYALVLAPASYLLSDRAAASLRDYVSAGGRLVVGAFSGIVDGNDRVPLGAPPGRLREVLGLRIPEFLPLSADAEARLDDGRIGRVWADDIVLGTAEQLVGFVDGPAAGGPAVTRNGYGNGSAWYFSPVLDADALDGLLEPVLAEAGVLPESRNPVGFERLVRVSSSGERFAVYINHTAQDVVVDADRALSGEEIVVGAGASRIVQLGQGIRR